MNNQNATLNAPSVLESKNFPFGEVLAKIAAVASSSQAIRSKIVLNKQSLRDSLKNEYTAAYPALCPKGYVSSETWDTICKEVESFILRQMNLVNKDNVISTVSKFSYNAKMSTMRLRHVVTGEDILSLKEERFGYVCLIADTEKQLHRLRVNPLPDNDKITKCEARLAKLNMDKNRVEAEIVRQQTL